MWWRRTSIQIRATSDAAAGPGIAARRDGCSARASKAFSGCAARRDACTSIRAFQKRGRASQWTIRYRSASYEIEVENPEGAGRGHCVGGLRRRYDRDATDAGTACGRRHHPSVAGRLG